ncbi:MAG: cyclic nucleotide-binding domain-containing protein [Flavobacteriales bacterium]|nr:MAG: cyclic nucleotide-binding domain-containing protein [Flavobacteriales bacterium]
MESKVNTRGSLRGDLAGGATAAIAAIPVELVYGLIAVMPLGAAYADHGLRAALWGCILGGVFAFVMRGTGGMLTGSRPATGLILGTLAAALLQHRDIAAAEDPAALVFILLLVCTMLAGAFQFAFGLARVGRALKYVPYPVVAGLMCGVASLMLLFALRPALGIPYAAAWNDAYGQWRPFSMLVAALTVAVCFGGAKVTRKVPSAVTALVAGTLLHHALVLVVGAYNMGETSGTVSSLLPDRSVGQWLMARADLSLFGWLSLLVPYALAIAAFASLETLLCLSSIETSRAVRLDADRELRIQGAANIVGGALGATSAVGNLSRVMINLSAGGGGRASSLAYSAVLASVVLFAGHWTGLVPAAVTAGILIFYAVQMVDDGTRRIAVQVFTQRGVLERRQYRVLLANFLVIVLVALVAVFGDMLKATAVGIAAAMFLFVRSSMKPVIRRVQSAATRRSLKVRVPEDMALLELEGTRIAIIEVEGPLFFGTADRLAREIDSVCECSDSVILDLRRVSDVDPTGGRTLVQASKQVFGQNRRLSFAGANVRVERFLCAMGLEACVPVAHWHHDVDSALQCEEDYLLVAFGSPSDHAVLHLSQTTLAHGLTASESSVLEAFLDKHLFDSPGKVFELGQKGESLFVATGSVVDIVLPLDNGKQKRVASFAPGVVFGEMALLEGKPRSADAIVQGPSTVWELSRDRLAEIEYKHPEIARRVLLNLSRSLAERLRATTMELRTAAEG